MVDTGSLFTRVAAPILQEIGIVLAELASSGPSKDTAETLAGVAAVLKATYNRPY